MAKVRSAVLVALLAMALPGCKIIKTPTAEEKAAETAKSAFDPAAKVEAIWQSQAIPYLQKRAGERKDVVALATSSPDEAGAKYANTRKQASAPWTYAVKLTGKVIAADTGSRAATIDVDADGDGKADAKVQIDRLLNSVSHNVDILSDSSKSGGLPGGNAISVLARSFQSAPSNVGKVVVVGANPFFKALLQSLQTISLNRAAKNIHFVKSTEEAQSLLKIA
jgi:hypothetical protein